MGNCTQQWRVILLFVMGVAVSPYTDLAWAQNETSWTPKPVIDIVHARHFTLAQDFLYTWSGGRQYYRSGTILVLRVDPQLVIPRNTAEPILYVGNQTAMRLNQGDQSGVVVAIVPELVDLRTATLWFGTPGLPEQVIAETIEKERALAERADIRPFPQDKVDAVTMPAVETSSFSDLLRGEIADLVLRYSPRESDLARKWRLPATGSKQDEPKIDQ